MEEARKIAYISFAALESRITAGSSFSKYVSDQPPWSKRHMRLGGGCPQGELTMSRAELGARQTEVPRPELPSRCLAGPRSGATVQEPRDAPDRRAPLRQYRRAPLARPHPRLHCVRGAAGR